MDWIVSASLVISKGIAALFLNPFLYIFFIVAWMHVQRQTWFERRLFHRRLNQPFEQWARALIHGLLGGIFASLLLILLGTVFQPFDLWTMAALSLLFSFFHIQSLSIAYAAGCYAFAVAIAKLWPQGADVVALSGVWERLSAADLASLIGLAALAYMMESALARVNRARGATPLFLNGKRGRLVGAYQLQKIWVLPMFFVVYAPTGTEFGWSLPAWWPMLSTASGAQFTLIGFPIALGFSNFMLSQLPRERSKRAAKMVFRYGLLLFVLAIASKWSPLVGAFAGLLALMGHPLLIRWNDWREWNKPALFVQSGKGAVVLAVFPDTPADKMGVLPGDVITKVNDQQIADSADLYPALQLNPAFCKMEVQNAEGHTKYVQRAVYEGEHHQLGLILAPDEETPYYVDLKPIGIAQLFNQQMNRGA